MSLPKRCATIDETGELIMSKTDSKYYTMQEMAGKVGVNKSTVYRYLLKEGIAPATTKRNTNLYNATALQRVKEHFSKKNSNNSEKKAPNDLLIETLRQQVSSLQNELINEKSRSDKALIAKDKQIDDLNVRLAESHQLQLGLQKELEIHKDSDSSNHLVLDGQTVSKTNYSKSEKKKTPEGSKKGFWSKLFH